MLVLVRVAPAADHPGNVFVLGEDVRAKVPAAWKLWNAVDIDGAKVGEGEVKDGKADLGKLPVGYYEIREKDGLGPVSAGVVAPVEAVENTPVALDAAMSWFYADEEMIRGASRLCRLAGVRWVRDRASWPELETARGTWAAGDTRYERAMRIQREMGLKILQVNHIAPPWAGADPKRFPEDLRDVHNFCRGLAKRWKDLADAIEPWNEPDIDVFGGHTGCEIASFQKAAYLGLKAGDPDKPTCGTVFAIDRAETLEEFGANEVHPYLDRYGLHHYIRLHEYPRAYARHRAVSGGRPMWTTEFNLPVWWEDPKTHEPSEEELRYQCYRAGKVTALALHEGCEKAFYFILGHYVERNIQYGLVRPDLTPRPAFVSFCAVGRLLNGATPLGRADLGDEKLMGYVFKTRVDGAERETLVAWNEGDDKTIEFPGAVKTYDFLGRELPGDKVELTRKTVFVVFLPGGSKQFKLTPPPAKPKWLEGKPSPVVLQLIGKTDFKQSAFVIGNPRELQLVAYNFGDKPARGKVSLSGATGLSGEIEIAPGARDVRTIQADGAGNVTVRLDLGDAGHAIVSARTVNK